MPSTLVNLLNEHKEQVAEALLETPVGQRARGRTPEERNAALLASLDGIIGLLQQRPDVREQTLQELARGQLREVSDADEVTDAIFTERNAIYDAIRRAYPEADDALETVADLERLTFQRARVITALDYQQVIDELQESLANQERLRETVQELSTPIIPVYSGVLVLPLVGRIDSARSQNITEALLEAIAREQAELVLLDITGVAVVDTSVANHLIQTAHAASLLGSQVVLVGISAEVAQTLVQLGVDLGKLKTLSNLQSGLEYALDRQGLAIRPKA
jgi:rsbT co-antagonist protein RsbR